MSAATVSVPVSPSGDRRVAQRFQPAFGTICRLVDAAKSSKPLVGLVWNISETGLSMLLGNPPSTGSFVVGELTADDSNDHKLPVKLHVVHVRPIQTGDYICGAKFDRRLAPDELRLFLVPHFPGGPKHTK